MEARAQARNMQATVLRIALLAVAYYLAARLGLLLALGSSNASPVWPPSGLAFGTLALFGIRLWPGVLAGAFAANFAVFSANGVEGNTLLASLLIASGNTLEAIAGAWLLRRFSGGARRSLGELQNVYKFGLIVALASAVSASIGTMALVSAHIVPAAAKAAVFSTWWVGDFAGMLVIAPLMLSWGTRRAPSHVRHVHWIGVLFALAALAAALFLVFGARFDAASEARWLAYLFVPLLAWAAYRLGLRGASIGMLLITAGAVIGTKLGLGPFASGTLNDALVALETFVAICCMVSLVLSADIRERRRLGSPDPVRQVAAHWATLLGGLAIAIFVWNQTASVTERRAQERFNSMVRDIRERIEQGIENSERGLRSAQAMLRATGGVSRGQWQKYVEGLDLPHTMRGVQGISYSELVDGDALPSFEQAAQEDGAPGFKVFPQTTRGNYVVVKYIEPLTPANQRVLGFDLASEPVRRVALLRARDSGLPAATARIELRQEEGEKSPSGFLLVLPIYRHDAIVQTQQQRARALRGYVVSVYRVNDLIGAILGKTLNEVGLEVTDDAVGGNEAKLYSNLGELGAEKLNYPNPLMATATVSVADRTWSIRVRSLSTFEESIDRQKQQIVLIAGSIISLLFFGFVRALSARREYAQALANDMTAALNRSERKFESLVESASEFALIAIDLDGLVRVFSIGAERLLGYNAHEMVGQVPLTALFAPDEARMHGLQPFVARSRDGQSQSDTFDMLRKDGSKIPVRMVVSAIRDSEGLVTGYLAVASDITQQRELEMTLRHAKEQAESASRAKGEFLANMSHEIRTPMNAVLGMAHLLGETSLLPEQREYLDMIRGSGQSLLRILNDILDFSKIEAGALEISPASFELGDLLNALAKIMTAAAGERDIELAIGVEEDVPRALVGDALRLQQVLVNLASNAIKFTAHGEVSLLVSVQERKDKQVRLVFTMRDTGIGMDEQQRSRLFGVFQQADASMTRRFGGTGLGLAISRRLVDLMGGTIEVESTPGRGSEFTVTLTLGVDDGATDHRSSKRVLVVDDYPTSRDFLCMTIRAWGWEADSAESGQAAIELAQRQSYDAILVDWQMPGMDGLAAIAAIRNAVPNLTAPAILMVSAFARGKLSHEADVGQADAILAKPVTASSLFDVLQDVRAAAVVPGHKPIEPAETAQHGRLEGVRILLVEDNALNQVVARGMLELSGARVAVVGNGREAVERLRKDHDQFDLVLMDVQMPVMDGFAATRMVRNDFGLRIPILAMTAGVTASERDQCIASGMNDFIAKPVDLELMLHAIERNLPKGRVSDVPAKPRSGGGVFEPGTLLEMGKGNPALRTMFVNLVAKVVARGTSELDKAMSDFRDGLSAEAQKDVHSLRGSIGTLGAQRFAAAALELEHGMRANASNVEDLFISARRELENTINTARNWLEAHAPEAAQDVLQARLDLRSLSEFKRQLAESNIGACATYVTLRSAISHRMERQSAERLDSAIARLDFAGALEALNALQD